MLAVPPKIQGWSAVRLGKRYRRFPEQFSAMSVAGVATVDEVNRHVNRSIEYTPDKTDAWQAPADTFARGTGDCEDIALLKCALLEGLGLEWWLVIVYDKIARQDHAVVATPQGILDNRCDQLLPLDADLDYEPRLALNTSATFVYGEVD